MSGSGFGVPAHLGLGAAFGYRPEQALPQQPAESAADTMVRLEQILTSPELFLPKRNPCRDGEHPGAFESQATEGQLVCSRCLHHVEHEGDVLIRKTGASSMAMSG